MGNYAADLVLNYMFRGAAAASGTPFSSAGTAVSFVARLYSTCPTDSTAGTETNTSGSDGYTAPTFASSSSNWGVTSGTCSAASTGVITNCNATAISFGTVGGTAWTVNCIGITDATPNMYFWGPSSPTGTVPTGTQVSLATTQLSISIAMALPEVQDLKLAGLSGWEALELVAIAHGFSVTAAPAELQAQVEKFEADGEQLALTLTPAVELALQ
jgi:hypothetical protein